MERIEQETTVSFNDEEQVAQIWSASGVFQHRMERLGIVPLKMATRPDGGKNCWYEVPKQWVKLRKPRERTEEQKWADIEKGKRLAAASARRRQDEEKPKTSPSP